MRKTLVKGLFVIVGTLSLGLGVIGVFVPLLPTTPFLLLAAACYAKGSERFYKWLLQNRWFGTYIKNYRNGKGIPLKVKVFTIITLWVTILFSTFMFISDVLIQILLIIIAIGVSLHITTIKTCIADT